MREATWPGGKPRGPVLGYHQYHQFIHIFPSQWDDEVVGGAAAAAVVVVVVLIPNTTPFFPNPQWYLNLDRYLLVHTLLTPMVGTYLTKRKRK